MRRQLVLVALATTTMITLAFLLPLALLIREVAQERALTGARQVAQSLAPLLSAGDADTLALGVQSVAAGTTGSVSVILPSGEVVGPEPTAAARAAADSRTATTVEVEGGVAVLTPLLDDSGATTTVQVVVPDGALRRGVTASWLVLGGLGIVLIVGATLVADRLGRSLVVPAREIAGAARRLAHGERDARAPRSGPPELADAAVALNTLADRIDALLAGEREAAADLSHRLRTPLTALRLDIEALGDDEPARRLGRDLDELERAVDRVIREAREPGTRVDPRVDLAALVRRRVAFWGPLAEEEQRPVEVEIPSAASLPTDVPEAELEAAIDALVGNVLGHTPPGTGLRVAVRDLGDRVELLVEDDGPGWPQGDVRGRGVSGAGSTGLGLDIVIRTAERHGGSAELTSSATGGAAVRMLLPRPSGPA